MEKKEGEPNSDEERDRWWERDEEWDRGLYGDGNLEGGKRKEGLGLGDEVHAVQPNDEERVVVEDC